MSAVGASADLGVGAAIRPTVHTRLLGFACVAALWAVLHPYLGIFGDAGIYIGRALADLDPAGVGRDMMFAHDGQSHFSVFPLIARVFVARFGTDVAAQTIAVAGSVAWLAALTLLAFQMTQGRAAWLIILFVVALPPAYGEPRHFMFAEMNAVPRPFAEAAVLAALAAHLAGKRGWTLALLAVAFLFHPLMALAGGAAVFLLLAFDDRRWIAAGGLLIALAVVLGMAGVPLFARLVTLTDPDWMRLMWDRGPFIFPLRWSSEAFGTLAIEAATLVIAARIADRPLRRLFIAALVVGLGGVAVALASDLVPVELLVQMQTWRATWLTAVLAEVGLALCTVELWRRGDVGRLTLAFLALGWFFDTDAVVAVPVGACAIALEMRGAALGPRLSARHVALAWGIAGGFILFWRGGQFASYVDYLRNQPADAPFDISVIVHNGIQALPICLGAAVWAVGRMRWPPVATAVVACVLAAIAWRCWDARTPTQKLIDAGHHPAGFEKLIAGRPGAVLWLDGLAEAWYVLGRPQWQSEQQAVSIIFSQALAREWESRTRILMALGLAKPNSLVTWRKSGDLGPVHVSRQAVATLCERRDAPSWIIMPLLRNGPRPEGVAYARWMLPQPLVMVRDDGNGAVWDWLEGYGVIPCATPAGSGAPAQVTAR